MSRLTVGADPELMLINKETGSLVSAIPLLEGTKYSPRSYKYGTTMHDNVNAEFAINPSKNEKEFLKFVRAMLKCVKTEIGPYYAMVPLPSATFPESELADEEARTFGCDPDFNGWKWKLRKNEVPLGANVRPFRSCGGHIHIGHKLVIPSFDGGWNMLRMIKLMDLFVGVPSVIIDCLPDAKARRKLYGKAGCFRPKPAYGVEWRTASNFWIGSPRLSSLIYNLTNLAVKALENDKTPAMTKDTKPAPIDPAIISEIGASAIQRTINNSDTKTAKKILETVLSPVIGDKVTQEILDCAKDETNRDLENNWGL